MLLDPLSSAFSEKQGTASLSLCPHPGCGALDYEEESECVSIVAEMKPLRSGRQMLLRTEC